MVVGAIIFAISMAADLIGIGANSVVIGWKQYFGAAVGIYIFLFGIHLVVHHVAPRPTRSQDQRPEGLTAHSPDPEH